MRSQIIQSQVAPALVLIAIFISATLGLFTNATNGAKYLAIGVAAATGILAIISQYAAIREGQALLGDLKALDKPSALAKTISGSQGLISLSAFAIVGIGLGVFALVVWAVLGK